MNGRCTVLFPPLPGGGEGAHRCRQVPSPRPSAYGALGMWHQAYGDLELAKLAYRHALEQAPGEPIARLNLGAALLRAGRPQEAVAEFEKVPEQNPYNPTAHFNLAAEAGDLEAARALAAAGAGGHEEAVTRLARRLALYQRGEPCREVWAADELKGSTVYLSPPGG